MESTSPRHFTEDGIKSLKSAVGDDSDPAKIIEVALNVSENEVKPVSHCVESIKHNFALILARLT